MRKPHEFDESYYRRYYRSPRTRVTTPRQIARLGAFVCAYLRHLEVPVRRVLDLGCGLGWWREVIAAQFPRASYQGVELSAYLCRRYGWTRGSAADFQGRGRYDLVICQGVLQYLSDRDAARAIGNLTRLCRGALYLEVQTREDWRDACDRRASDRRCFHRGARWYRARLRRHFVHAGGGVYLAKEAAPAIYALQTAE
jgi:SAM-dependent methyltransferase